MDIVTFAEGLQNRLKEKLDDLNAQDDELQKMGNALTLLREIIHDLKRFTVFYSFRSDAEEIKFFKEIKPVFLSQWLFYKKVFAIKLLDMYADEKCRAVNYNDVLNHMERFANKHLEFYQYCLSNSTHLDHLYFTRGKHNPHTIHRDEKFSTGYDVKLAKILAHQLIRKYVQDELTRSNIPDSLSWTASKTALIELIYALHTAEVFNNGATDIKRIASSFERFFNVNLGNYYRTFQEIRIRKSGQANFLEQIKTKFTQRLKEFDE